MLAWAIAAIENESDRDLVERLYAQYYALLFQKAYSVVRNRQRAEDAVDSAMLKFIDRIGFLRTRNAVALRSYLLTAVKNEAISQLRGDKRLYNFDDLEEKLGAAPGGEAPDAGLLREERIAEVAEALKRLPAREREALRMKYYEGLPDAEIAQILGTSHGAARTLVYRARKLLREIMEEVDVR